MKTEHHYQSDSGRYKNIPINYDQFTLRHNYGNVCNTGRRERSNII